MSLCVTFLQPTPEPEPQPQATVRNSVQEPPVSPVKEPEPPQSPVAEVPSESHMVQTLPTEQEEEEEAGVYEDTGYSAIALYDYQAGVY